MTLFFKYKNTPQITFFMCWQPVIVSADLVSLLQSTHPRCPLCRWKHFLWLLQKATCSFFSLMLSLSTLTRCRCCCVLMCSCMTKKASQICKLPGSWRTALLPIWFHLRRQEWVYMKQISHFISLFLFFLVFKLFSTHHVAILSTLPLYSDSSSTDIP